MTLPEPDEFTLEEIAKRWSAMEGEEYTVDYLYRLEDAGHLKIEYEFLPTDTLDREIKVRKDVAKYKANGLSASEAVMKVVFDKDLIRCLVTKTERDRFECDHNKDDLQNEPTTKSKNSYLRLTGYMAERLGKTDKLSTNQPYKAGR